MAFEPDILVSSTDESGRVLLVVEAKRWSTDPPPKGALAQAESQLRGYMSRVRCELGALVSPHMLRLFRDTFQSYEPDSIKIVADFELADRRLMLAADQGAGAFEDAVQNWLESLRDDSARARLYPPLRAAVEAHLLPVLWLGEVRAARHRFVADAVIDRGRDT